MRRLPNVRVPAKIARGGAEGGLFQFLRRRVSIQPIDCGRFASTSIWAKRVSLDFGSLDDEPARRKNGGAFWRSPDG